MQLSAFDAAKPGAGLGIATLVALCPAFLKRGAVCGLVIIGELSLGSIGPVPNPVLLAEIAMPVC